MHEHQNNAFEIENNERSHIDNIHIEWCKIEQFENDAISVLVMWLNFWHVCSLFLFCAPFK